MNKRVKQILRDMENKQRFWGLIARMEVRKVERNIRVENGA